MKMRSTRLALGAVLVLAFGTLESARADIISGSTSVTGPGGTGTADIDPSDSFVLNVTKDYTTLDYLDVTFSVDCGCLYILDELIQNSTSSRWLNFNYSLISAPAGTEFAFAFDASGHFAFAAPTSTPITSFTFYAGSVDSGDSFHPIVLVDLADAGTITIRQTPSTAGIVPEPTTLSSAAVSALVALAAACRRRKRTPLDEGCHPRR